jgi:predicted dehydrogenase
MKKIIVLGGGSIGKRHIRNILSQGWPAANLYAVDPREDRRAEVAGLGVPAANLFPSREAALAAGRYDGAIVASPTALHYADALALAGAGANLMIEKPIGPDLSGFDALAALVKEKGLFAFVAYCFRFDPVSRRFRELLRERPLGRPLYARAEMSTYLPAWHPYEDYRTFYMAKAALGGGTLLDQSHLFDLTRFFLGDIDTLMGVSMKYSDLEIETDDFGEMMLWMREGYYASLHIDLFTKVEREFFQVTCAEGVLEWNIGKRTITKFVPGQEPEVLLQGGNYNDMYLAEMAHFTAGLEGGAGDGLAASLEDARKVMDVVQAVRRSQLREQVAL